MRRELLPRFPHVDDIVALNHPYVCDVASDVPEAVVPIRTLRNMLRNPNFGGEIMVIGLGCEKLTADRLLEPEEIRPENVLMLQEHAGFVKMTDAFSGIIANPAAGYAADLLVGAGATMMLSKVTEVGGGVERLAERYADVSGERPSVGGFVFAATPASDMVCGTCQLASGMTLQVFMTGKGTPCGLAAAPVIKVSSRSNLKDMWSDPIDVDAGAIVSGEADIRSVGEQLFREIWRSQAGENARRRNATVCSTTSAFSTRPRSRRMLPQEIPGGALAERNDASSRTTVARPYSRRTERRATRKDWYL